MDVPHIDAPSWFSPVCEAAGTAALAIPVAGPIITGATLILGWLANSGAAKPNAIEQGTLDAIQTLSDPVYQATTNFNSMLGWLTTDGVDLMAQEPTQVVSYLSQAVAPGQTNNLYYQIQSVENLLDPTLSGFKWTEAIAVLQTYALGAAVEGLVYGQLMALSTYAQAVAPNPPVSSPGASAWCTIMVNTGLARAAKADASYQACLSGRLNEITGVSGRQDSAGNCTCLPISYWSFSYTDHLTGKSDSKATHGDPNQAEIQSAQAAVQSDHDTYVQGVTTSFTTAYGTYANAINSLRAKCQAWQALLPPAPAPTR